MNISKILPAIVLSAASLGLSTSVLADNPLTWVGHTTGAIVTGVGTATTDVVGGAVHGTTYVVHGVTHMWDGHKTVHHNKHLHHHVVHQS